MTRIAGFRHGDEDYFREQGHAEPGVGSRMISVAICTLDRAADLPGALEALERNRETAGDFEVVVVNNGRTERTREICADYKSRLPLRYVHEDTTGLGAARNRAVREARGEILAYADDDSLVCPNWIKVIRERFAALPADCVAITGPVSLAYPPGTVLSPDFHPLMMQEAFSSQNRGGEAFFMGNLEAPLGNNMAFRLALLRESGEPFSPVLRTFDELYAIWPHLWKGRRCFYDPAMASQHKVDRERISMRWILSKYRTSGRAYQYLVHHYRHFPDCPPRWEFLLRLPLNIAKCIGLRLLNRESGARALDCMIEFGKGRLEAAVFGLRPFEYSPGRQTGEAKATP